MEQVVIVFQMKQVVIVMVWVVVIREMTRHVQPLIVCVLIVEHAVFLIIFVQWNIHHQSDVRVLGECGIQMQRVALVYVTQLVRVAKEQQIVPKDLLVPKQQRRIVVEVIKVTVQPVMEMLILIVVVWEHAVLMEIVRMILLV